MLRKRRLKTTRTTLAALLIAAAFIMGSGFYLGTSSLDTRDSLPENVNDKSPSQPELGFDNRESETALLNTIQAKERPTRNGEDLDLGLKWLDGYGTIIGYMSSIKSADVDNDGDVEIVFGNSEGYVYVTGYSDEGFVEEWKTMVGTYTFGLSLDDVDGDGTIVIIVGNQDGFINIFGFNGTSYALEWTSPDLGSELYGLTTADIDDDGVIEIVAGCSVSVIMEDNLFVYKWQSGTYSLEWSYALTTTLGYLGIFNIAVGDVNDDGDKEIVAATYENEMIQNDPPVNPIPPNPRPQGGFGGRFYIFSNTGGLPEWQSDDFGEWIMGLGVDDTNGNGRLEIVITTYISTVYVFSHDGIAGIYRDRWSEDNSALALTVGDIDDDGVAEIVVSSWESILIYDNSGPPYNYQQVWASNDLDSMIYGLGNGIVDNDSINDILTGTVYRFYAHGHEGSTYIEKAESDNIGAMESIGSADLDNDGMNEILLGTGNGSVLVTTFDGNSLVTEAVISLSDRAITHLGVGDVDNDGDEEIIAIEGHTSTSWNENFVFRSASSNAIVYVIGYSGSSYEVEAQIDIDVGGAFCSEVGDVDGDGIPEILLGGTGYDEVNEDPFVGQIEVIDFESSQYQVVWESYYFDNWVMGVAIGDADGDGDVDIVTEDRDGSGQNLLRLFQYNGATYVEHDTIFIDSENFALDMGDCDQDSASEIVSKGIFGGLLEVFGRSGSNYIPEWDSDQFTTFIDECFAISGIRQGGIEYLIFGELGVFIFEYDSGFYSQIWHSAEIPASIKTLHISDIDSAPGNDIIGSSGGYNFIYGEGGTGPFAHLSISNDNVTVGENVQFDGSLSTGSGALEYFFDFGDGTNSSWVTTPIVYHSYSTDGIFHTSLKIRDATMVESPESPALAITVNIDFTIPVAVIDSITPNPANEGDSVSFSGHGTDDGSIVNYEWISSINGWLSNQASFDYSGLSDGVHTISFKVRDDDGTWSDVVQSTLRINQIPTAIIDSISPNPATEGYTVSFEGRGTDDGSITAYNWRSSINGFIDDEAQFSTSSLSHGNHVIYLKVKDDEGVWSSETSRGLEINQIPVAVIDSISPDPALIGELVTFTGHGNDDGGITAYNWESDVDGFLSSKSSFSNSRLSQGEHTISFKVRDNKGVWSENTEGTVTVMEAPENLIPYAVIESPAPQTIKKGEDVTFIGFGTDSDGEIDEYLWESDMDGVLSEERSFSTSDLSVGTHVITFRVMDDRGDWSEPALTAIEVKKKADKEADIMDISTWFEEPSLLLLLIVVIIVVIVALLAVVTRKKETVVEPYYEEYPRQPY